MRIISLLPSATEIICALGLRDQLVGRSHECDYPHGVEQLPVCTAPRFSASGDSGSIDKEVKGLVRDGLSIYEVKKDVLEQLRPDVIVTQSQCEVCAVSLPEVEAAVRDLVATEARLVNLHPKDYEAVYQDILRTGQALDRSGRAEELVTDMRGRIQAVADQGKEAEPVSVACSEWLEPLMNAGNWMPDLITLGGGRDVFAHKGDRSHYIEWTEVRVADPEALLLLPCGFSIQRTLQELDLLTHRPGWKELRAVREGRVYVTDGNQYFNRPGPRLADSVEIVSEMLHPGLFAGNYKGTGWITL